MALLNKEFYEKLDKKIDAIPSQEDAKAFVKQAFEPIQKQLNDTISKLYNPLNEKLTSYIGEVNAIQLLLNPPTSPDAVVEWAPKVISAFSARINTIKTQIKPYVMQYSAAQEALSGLPAEAETLKSHLERKIKEKGWNVIVPQIIVPTLPPLPPIPSILK